MFDERALVLEGVTLAQVVELVVEVLVDLAGGTVLDEKAAEDSLTAHPEDLAVDISISACIQPSVRVQSVHSSRSRQFNVQYIPEWWSLPRHSGVLGTLPLTEAPMSALAAGLSELTGAGPRVHGHGLLDDEAILEELLDGLARVGGGDLVDLVGVEPDLAFSAAGHGRGQALLGGEVDPARKKKKTALVVSFFSVFLRDDLEFPSLARAKTSRPQRDKTSRSAGFHRSESRILVQFERQLTS